jgi:taurine dioxygenase
VSITDDPATRQAALTDMMGPMGAFPVGPRTLRVVPDDWADRPYTRITVDPIAPVIGAEIGGISLADPVDEELFEELNRALLEWKVLVFRDQHITAEQQRDFAANWGGLEAHPFVRELTDQPDQVEVLRLEKNANVPGLENGWHSDVTWRECPSLGSILRAVVVPPVGGDTLWADMGAAYDNLTVQMQEHLEGRTAVHDWITTFGLGMDEDTRTALRVDFPAQEHPIVRTHPETGRKTLFVNRAFTQHVVGMGEAESRALLRYLYTRAMFPEFQCRVRWQAGDVVFWDNRSTQHYASSDYYPAHRVMERITIVGDRPT